MVSIPSCHDGYPGSIPGRRAPLFFATFWIGLCGGLIRFDNFPLLFLDGSDFVMATFFEQVKCQHKCSFMIMIHHTSALVTVGTHTQLVHKVQSLYNFIGCVLQMEIVHNGDGKDGFFFF